MCLECTDHVPVVLAVRPHDGGDEEQQGAEDGHLQGHQLEQQQRPPAIMEVHVIHVYSKIT